MTLFSFTGFARRLVATFELVTTPQLDERLHKLEEKIRMTLSARKDELNLRLATRIGMLMAENASLADTVATKDDALAAASDALTAEVTGRDATVKAQVDAALALDAQRDIARIEEHLRLAGEDIPVDVPVVDTPPAGEPAPLPDEAPADMPVIDETTLPTGNPTEPQ